jgi:type IV pilus biogenesis protein CpaD/CtpE
MGKPTAIGLLTLLALLAPVSALLQGCAAQTTSPLQNQYGPAASATRAAGGTLPDFWFATGAVHPSFALATNWNLGAQVADQRELSATRALGPPNPMAAVGAVDRYQKGQVRALPEASLEAGGAQQE